MAGLDAVIDACRTALGSRHDRAKRAIGGAEDDSCLPVHPFDIGFDLLEVGKGSRFSEVLVQMLSPSGLDKQVLSQPDHGLRRKDLSLMIGGAAGYGGA